ncbi:hypothetical protein M3936_13400 [Sutcliffiella horikoshii]|nr:hypothetical protein [Sutcliffiella horikoshii]MCM3618580.1 hypothetical protein [Sutcliffiella horikoshii]
MGGILDVGRGCRVVTDVVVWHVLGGVWKVFGLERTVNLIFGKYLAANGK